jgi:hypothetical protein
MTGAALAVFPVTLISRKMPQTDSVAKLQLCNVKPGGSGGFTTDGCAAVACMLRISHFGLKKQSKI